jgi:hypothetical protein
MELRRIGNTSIEIGGNVFGSQFESATGRHIKIHSSIIKK